MGGRKRERTPPDLEDGNTPRHPGPVRALLQVSSCFEMNAFCWFLASEVFALCRGLARVSVPLTAYGS